MSLFKLHSKVWVRYSLKDIGSASMAYLLRTLYKFED